MLLRLFSVVSFARTDAAASMAHLMTPSSHPPPTPFPFVLVWDQVLFDATFVNGTNLDFRAATASGYRLPRHKLINATVHCPDIVAAPAPLSPARPSDTAASLIGICGGFHSPRSLSSGGDSPGMGQLPFVVAASPRKSRLGFGGGNMYL